MPKMWAKLRKKADLEDQHRCLTRYNLDVLVMETLKLFSKLISTNTDDKTEENKLKDITA